MGAFDLNIVNGDATASRREIQTLFDVPRKTLADAIKALKEDGLVSGAESRHTASDGKSYLTELYNLDEIIAIGFRTRSAKAIEFQRWSIGVIKNQLLDLIEKRKIDQAQLDYFWDKEDQKDIYGKG